MHVCWKPKGARVAPRPAHTATLTTAISNARVASRREKRHVRVPCLLAGIVLFSVGARLTTSYQSEVPGMIGLCGQATGIVLFLLCVHPADDRLVRLANGAMLCGMLFASAVTAAFILAPRLQSRHLASHCAPEARPFESNCREKVLDIITPCVTIVSITGTALMAAHARWQRKLGARELLETSWLALSRACAVSAILLLVRVVIIAATEKDAAKLAGKLILGLWLGLLMAFIRSPSMRLRLQQALAERSSGFSNPASAYLAAFTGSSDASELAARAEASFRTVPLSLVRPEHFEQAEPDGALFALSTPAPLAGRCDCYVSHSHADNAADKFRALLAWGRRFEQQHGRAPMVWIDRFCLPPPTGDGDSEPSTALLLPCFLAASSSFLALAGTSYFSRLWCIVEMLLFVGMGAPPSAIEIVLLSEESVPLHQVNVAQARCADAEDQRLLLATIDAGGCLDDVTRYVRGVLAAAASLTVAELEEEVREHDARVAAGSGAARTPHTPEKRTEFLPEEQAGGVRLGRPEAITALLERAHTQGSARRRRLRMVTLLAGGLCLVVGCVGSTLFEGNVRRVTTAVLITGVAGLLLSVLPTERKLVRVVCSATLCLLLLGSALQVRHNVIWLSSPAPECEGLPRLRCRLQRDRTSVPFFVASLVVITVWFACALRLGWLLARRPSGRHLLDAVWSALGISVFSFALQAVVIWATSPESSSGAKAAANAAANAAILALLLSIVAIGFLPRVRARLTGLLASRGAANSSASQIAQLMGAGSAEETMRLSKELLRSVSFSAMRAEDFVVSPLASNAFARTQPAHIGEIDAFVSHSWQADPAAKWAVLQEWAKGFKQQHGRWPLLWVDRFCVNPLQMSASIACVPVFVSASNTLLVLYDDTFLSRLWCVVELFSYLVTAARVGGTLVVRRLPEDVDEQNSVGSTARPISACEAALIRQRLSTFDVRLAECSVARDREHLLDLIDAFPGGLSEFNRAVRQIFYGSAFVSSGVMRKTVTAGAHIIAQRPGSPVSPAPPPESETDDRNRGDAAASPL